MPITLVSHTGKVLGSIGGTTLGIVTTLAKLIVLHLSYQSGTSPVISDSMGNTWIALTLKAGTNSTSRLWYCLNPTVGASHTFTSTLAGQFSCIQVLAFTIANGGFDLQAGLATVSANSINPGTFTPSVAGELIVTGVAVGTNAS